MLPLHQAYEIRESIISYLRATFSFNDSQLEEAFDAFITDPNNGMFKGPYLSMKLPFETAEEKEVEDCPMTIKPSWPPYDHQIKSWNRLSSVSDAQPTIITTGTGSGKTESFLYPLLDHCYRNKDRKGIKAIILYPMNALATDQAKRLAEAIHEDERLKGIRAGLFIGLGHGNKNNYPSTMSADRIIENRNELMDAPPDILLTNFKMLDYGLMRGRDQALWQHNVLDPTLLQYLVLDELHTYDGAQGTDVANLLRRLKLKLKVAQGAICPVGTSATISTGENSKEELALYASKLFGEDITSECIVTERRQPINEFFNIDHPDQLRPYYPSVSELESCNKALDVSIGAYEMALKKSWNISANATANEVSQSLLQYRLFYDVLHICQSGVISIEDLIKTLVKKNKDLKYIPEWDEEGRFDPRITLIESLLALLSIAKTGPKGRFPLVNVQIQLWIKELSKVLRKVSHEYEFLWNDSSYRQKSDVGLPPYYCRECGASGWLAVKADNHNKFGREPKDVYNKFFEHHKNLWLLNLSDVTGIAEYQPTEHIEQTIDKHSLEFSDGHDEARDVKVVAYRKVNTKHTEHYCPECNSKNSIAIIGTRIATLSSIAISQNLSTDLDQTAEKERKVLAFTNSVQDAAHQSGFVEARNYRFTFRTSLQQVINKAKGGIRLDRLADQFIDTWSAEGERYYWRFFPSDYFGKATPENYKEKGVLTEAFKKEFRHRMTWQVFEEFGNRALIGRTLEKSLASSADLSTTLISRTYEKIQGWLNDNNLAYIKQEEFAKFLIILFYRIRTRGGVSHRYFQKARTGKLILWELNWSKDNRHFLNPKYFENRSRFPKLVSVENDRKALTDSTFTKKVNWFHRYFIKSFPLSNTDLINEFYAKLFEVTTDVGITDKVHSIDSVSYALWPQALTIQKEGKSYKCSTCNSKITSALSADYLNGAKCINYRCDDGVYQLEEANSLSYYKQVYNRALSPRIYSSEHTGLLERRRREKIEIDFKQRTKFNSYNVLVATSTLEMGIDIGTLNTAINNSIPPLPSNYLQRIGRAGRSSGTALLLNFAKTQDHDLYYYDDPFQMMEGDISTPGCYLEAKEILTRHYMAYCIDHWVDRDPIKNVIPTFLKSLKLKSLDIDHPDFFVNRLFTFVDDHTAILRQNFSTAYSDFLTQEQLDVVIREFENGNINDKFKRVFERLKGEERQSAQRRKDIDTQIKEKQLQTGDPEFIALKDEQKSLSRLWNAKQSLMVIEYLTNVGLLPNYAFPETGVNLEALILPAYTEGIVNQDNREEISIVRGAGQAIKELAPDNSFFTQGHKLPISGINTVDWTDPLIKSKKRFCSNCDYIADQITDADKCPKCQHESFGSVNNVHSFVKLTGVKSVVNKSQSQLSDDKDERDREIFNMSSHLDFGRAVGSHAYVIEEESFGIEYVSELKLKDINLGHSESVSANKIKLNDSEVPSHGFVTCKHCGYATSRPGLYKKPESRKLHFGYCKHKLHDYKDIEDEVFEHIYLFREFSTEALKIRVPRTDIDDNIDIKILSSALQVGLRLYFRGSPSHIKIREYREYNKAIERFEQYIVLIDSIPGGTSYLQNIFNIEDFNKILALSYERHRDCSCQHEGLDGCYKCIYTYENQYIQEELSRSKAVSILSKLVEKSGNWIEVDSLGSVAQNGGQEESELEDRFTFWLENLNQQEYYGSQFTITTEKIYDELVRIVVLENAHQIIRFSCRQQVHLTPRQGVKYHTRPDVLITCESIFDKTTKTYLDDVSHLKQLAIYMDGYRYHATMQNNLGYYADVKKRNGLIASKRYIPWTLTWSDFDLFTSTVIDDRKDKLYVELNNPKYRETRQFLEKSLKKDYIRDVNIAQNSLDRLLVLLANFHQLDQYRQSMNINLGLAHSKRFFPSYGEDSIPHILNFNEELSTTSQYISDLVKFKTGLVAYEGTTSLGFTELRIFVNIFKKQLYYSLNMIESSTDLNKSSWAYFWQLFNVISLNEQSETAAVAEIDYGLLDYCTDVYKDPIKQLLDNRVIQITRENEGELFELTDAKGIIVASAELILKDYKEVFEPASPIDADAFVKNGYSIKEIETFDIKDYIKK